VRLGHILRRGRQRRERADLQRRELDIPRLGGLPQQSGFGVVRLDYVLHRRRRCRERADYNGIHWSSPTLADPGGSPLSVSCTSSTFCVAGDVSGNATIYDGTDWSTPSQVNDNVMVSLSCGSSTFCVGVDDAGFAVTYSGVTQQASCTTGGTACSAAVTAPSQTVDVTGAKPSSTKATITVSVTTLVLACNKFAYSAPVTTVQDTGLTSVTVTDTIAGLPSAKGVVICFQPLGAPPHAPSFLGKCHGKKAAGPCYKSLTEVPGNTEATGSIVAKLVLPGEDPRFHIGGEAAEVTSVSPTSVKAGKKLTIKGLNLSEVTLVTIGGVAAKILKTAPTSVKVVAPAGAHGAVSVSSLAGQASSATVVTVTSATEHGGPAHHSP
jgi:hypothetical protein